MPFLLTFLVGREGRGRSLLLYYLAQKVDYILHITYTKTKCSSETVMSHTVLVLHTGLAVDVTDDSGRRSNLKCILNRIPVTSGSFSRLQDPVKMPLKMAFSFNMWNPFYIHYFSIKYPGWYHILLNNYRGREKLF